MFQSFRKVSALLFFVGVLSFSMVSVSFAASDAENSLAGFFKKLFHYPMRATQETASMTANTLQNTGEKVIAKTGENTKAVVMGDVAKTGQLVADPVVGTLQTAGQTVSETAQIPAKTAEEEKK